MIEFVKLFFGVFTEERKSKITLIGVLALYGAVIFGEYDAIGKTSFIEYRRIIMIVTAIILLLGIPYVLNKINIFNQSQMLSKTAEKFNENRIAEFEKLISDLQGYSNNKDLDAFKRRLDCYEYSTDVTITLDVIPIGTSLKNNYKVTIIYNNITKIVNYKEI